MNLALIVGLILFGIFLILIEIFITPGFIVGLVGIVFLGLGVFYTYQNYGNNTGHLVFVGSAVFLGVTLVLAFRNGAWNKFSIPEVITGKANNVDTLDVNVGDHGTTISALRPAGTALVNGQKMEVHADGDFVLANEEVEVVKKVQNRIYIKKINT